MSASEVLKARREQLALDAAREACGKLSAEQFLVSRQDLLAEVTRMREVLVEVEEVLAEREDADYDANPESGGFQPNWAMKLAERVREVLR